MPTRLRGRVLALAVVLQVLVGADSATAQRLQRRLPDTVPSQSYFRAIERLYDGEYRDAERTFFRELRGGIKIGVTNRWIDSIAYHAMLGEVYYHQGRLAEALEQFDYACLMYLQYPTWPIRIEFKRDPVVDTNRLRQVLPWGSSTRKFTLGRFPSQELISFGDPNSANRVAQQGGVLQAPQLWQVNAIEIVRATALAIRRRNELLGPLGAHDRISRDLVATLSRGITRPNHWSKAWADLLHGLAQVGVGKPGLAEKRLQRSQLVRGQFDHPLTCVAMLELGRLKMEAGDLATAAQLFAEASYSAFYFDDLGIIDEAFRLGTKNHLASGPQSVNGALEPAANWASRKRYDHIFSRLSLALSEELLHLGNANGAQAALRAGQARLEDAVTGLLGSRSQYLDARLQFRQGRETAEAALSQAVGGHLGISHYNLQLRLANQRFDNQQLRARSAVEIYQALLDDPQPADWVFRPFETLAALQTPRTAAFDRWFDAAISQKNMGMALEISDLAKRHRYHQSLAWGGRLAALRDALEAPESQLSKRARNQRNELLLRYPEYDAASKAGSQLEAELRAEWQPDADEREQRALVKTWRAWSKNLGQREAMLSEIGLQRVPADVQFPPTLATTALQAQLKPGQAIAVFHEAPNGLHGFLVTAGASTSWKSRSKKRLGTLVSNFLRDLGNFDANHQMTTAQLASTDWEESGNKLYAALFDGSSLDPESLEELIIVPDGVVWYVPFAALPVVVEDRTIPLISAARVRLAPTVGLAVGHAAPWRRVQRTGIVGNEILPGDSEEEQAEALDSLYAAVENPMKFPSQVPVPSPIVGSLVEILVVLDDIHLELSKPLGWSPLPLGRSAKRGSLSHWLTLPQFGPQRVILPAAHNLAERGGKTSKRKSTNVPPGTELFMASCGLMSTGAQTILLSSWRVGGDSTLELVREFLQELPYTNASAAWQRSVQLAMELPLNSEFEPRVKTDKDNPELSAAHPFFWSGYQLIDTGAAGEKAKPKPDVPVKPAAGS